MANADAQLGRNQGTGELDHPFCCLQKLSQGTLLCQRGHVGGRRCFWRGRVSCLSWAGWAGPWAAARRSRGHRDGEPARSHVHVRCEIPPAVFNPCPLPCSELGLSLVPVQRCKPTCAPH